VLPVATWLGRPLAAADPLRPADAVVVLGGGVIDAQTPERETLVRLVHGIRLWSRGLAPLLIVTGANPREPSIPEADVMARVATDLGVPPDSARDRAQGARTWTQGQAVAHRPRARAALGPARDVAAAHVPGPARLPPGRPRDRGRADRDLPRLDHARHLSTLDVLQRVGSLSPVLYEYAALALYRWRGWI